MKVLICKALTGPVINHEKFISVSNVRRAYNEIKKQIKGLKNALEYTTQEKWRDIVSDLNKIN